jgi:hypothetical protein
MLMALLVLAFAGQNVRVDSGADGSFYGGGGSRGMPRACSTSRASSPSTWIRFGLRRARC